MPPGTEHIAIELGAARERVEWLAVQNRKLEDDAREYQGAAERYFTITTNMHTSLVAWRMAALVGLAMAGLFGTLVFMLMSRPPA
ncbi:hypothetical protein [Cellulomonas xiejunii]|uniref:hypothetical protein n=1 Tax=Cellulomonas xiejunii TaxID=2968083 RepID=UPI001D0E284F|nr:hypothetical protein [Cellulomonas xiejunii]MCC2319721.1 hypothetical protein [Cellulomonas xiejunii]